MFSFVLITISIPSMQIFFFLLQICNQQLPEMRNGLVFQLCCAPGQFDNIGNGRLMAV